MTTNLAHADLTEALLIGTDFEYADLSWAVLRRARLGDPGAYEVTPDARYGEMKAADLSCATLHGADLRDAWLAGADLTGADLYFALLNGARLHGTILHGADLSRANVAPHAVTNAVCDAQTTLPHNFNADAAKSCVRKTPAAGSGAGGSG